MEIKAFLHKNKTPFPPAEVDLTNNYTNILGNKNRTKIHIQIR